MRQPNPLQWPEGWPRHTPRDDARFSTTHAVACVGITNRLRLMKASNVVITSDMPARRDGFPLATGKEPADPGIAVYWVDPRGEEQVMACDRWKRVVDNLHAVHLSLDALAGLSRWGASEVVRRAFQGFKALPPAGGEQRRPWHEVLGLPPETLKIGLSARTIMRIARDRHKELIATVHPDKGGEPELALRLNVALQEAEAELCPEGQP